MTKSRIRSVLAIFTIVTALTAVSPNALAVGEDALTVGEDVSLFRVCALNAATPQLFNGNQIVGAGSITCGARQDVMTLQLCLEVQMVPGSGDWETLKCDPPTVERNVSAISDNNVQSTCVEGTRRYRTRAIGTAEKAGELKFEGWIVSGGLHVEGCRMVQT